MNLNPFDDPVYLEKYQRGEFDSSFDTTFEIAAMSGRVLLPPCPDRAVVEAANGPYDMRCLLLPVNLDTWGTIAQAYAAGMDIFPRWFTYNTERGYFYVSEQILCQELIRAYKLTRHNGPDGYFMSDGERISDDEVREMILRSVSIVRADAGNKLWGYFQALRTYCKATAPETPIEAPALDSVTLFDMFLDKVQTEAYKPIKTGMAAFDELLRGGIPAQSLVILSAAPGTGKTTLAQQILETAAAQGTDVIFLNLEMSREQLLARSLSRLIYQNGGNISASDIMRGYAWTDAQKRYITEAAAQYREKIAPHMVYSTSENGTTLTAILEVLTSAANKARKENRPAPVCCLDYLHLVTAEGREDQSEILKRTVAALKRWAMEYNTFVLAICANSRTANNRQQITLDAGRDTSALEYTADIQISLNYKAVHEGIVDPSSPDAMETLHKEKPRQVVCQVLKNRMTEPGGKLYLNLYSANSLFIPVDNRRSAPTVAERQELLEWKPIDDQDNPFN